MTPEDAAALLRWIDTRKELGELDYADRPHVLVASWPGGSGPALGPYPDLFAAEGARVVWEQQLNDGNDVPHVDVDVLPLFAPGT